MLNDEKRMGPVCHGQFYQNRMTKAFKKSETIVVHTGADCLENIFLCQKEAK